MDRARAERILRDAYEARRRGDVPGVVRDFADGVSFLVTGSAAASPVPSTATGKAAVEVMLGRLVASFSFEEISLVHFLMDGDRAAARWRVRVRGPGGEAVTELADFVEFADGRIVSFTQFADTALAAKLLGR